MPKNRSGGVHIVWIQVAETCGIGHQPAGIDLMLKCLGLGTNGLGAQWHGCFPDLRKGQCTLTIETQVAFAAPYILGYG